MNVLARLESFRALVNAKALQLLSAMGFWQLNWWTQIFAVVGLLIATTVLMVGPLLLAAWRFFRDGDRPSIPATIVILFIGATGGIVLLMLARLAQQVVERHPGPLI